MCVFGKSLAFLFQKMQTMGELLKIPMSNLSEGFPTHAKWVYNIARGEVFATSSFLSFLLTAGLSVVVFCYICSDEVRFKKET